MSDEDCEETQIGACTDDNAFSQYVTPSTKPISASATAVTGLAIRDNIMYKNGHQVLSKTTREAFQSFVDWTKQYTNIILVAHNAMFDSRVIVRVFDSVGLCANDFFIGLLTLCHYVENSSQTENRISLQIWLKTYVVGIMMLMTLCLMLRPCKNL